MAEDEDEDEEEDEDERGGTGGIGRREDEDAVLDRAHA